MISEPEEDDKEIRSETEDSNSQSDEKELVGNKTEVDANNKQEEEDVTIEFECDPGYDLVGAKEAKCKSDGTLSEDVPQCKRKLHIYLYKFILSIIC